MARLELRIAGWTKKGAQTGLAKNRMASSTYKVWSLEMVTKSWEWHISIAFWRFCCCCRTTPRTAIRGVIDSVGRRCAESTTRRCAESSKAKAKVSVFIYWSEKIGQICMRKTKIEKRNKYSKRKWSVFASFEAKKRFLLRFASKRK
jgi:hypothetical protein